MTARPKKPTPSSPAPAPTLAGADGVGDADASLAPLARLGPADELVDRFVEAWGRMGSVWGISRTMAEVHALLYITGEPMCTDDIMARLQISRGNASMSIRALLEWGIVARAHRRGDRKEYFQAEQDVWAVFRAIVRERIKREVDPLLVNLHEIRDHTRLAPAASTDDAQRRREIDARLDAMLEFFQLGNRLAERFIGPSGPGLRIAANILARTPAFPGTGRPKPRGQADAAPDHSSEFADHDESPETETPHTKGPPSRGMPFKGPHAKGPHAKGPHSEGDEP